MSLKSSLRVVAIVLLLTGAAHGQARPKQACDAAFSGTQTARKAGRLAEARELANKCIEGCPAFARSECVRWLREVDDAQPSIVLHVEGASSASVLVDDRLVASDLDGRAIDVDPGKHTVVVALPSGEKRTSMLVVSEGEKRRTVAVSFAPPVVAVQPAVSSPPKQGHGLHPLFWAGVGTTVVGATVGTVAGILALGYASDVRAHCPGRVCPPAYHSTLDALSLSGGVATVGFIVAGVGAALTVTGLLLPGRRTEAAWAPGAWVF